jgi:hypothetical protein
LPNKGSAASVHDLENLAAFADSDDGVQSIAKLGARSIASSGIRKAIMIS